MSLSDNTFITKVERTIDRYRMLGDGFVVVVAVSGGPDSVALLHVLGELSQTRFHSLKLHVAHLNHMLRREESDADEDFVRRLAERLELPFRCERWRVQAVAEASGRNVEDVARELRYQFLRQVATEIQADRIATGHTLTDQAETLLMRLIRGAGGEGLSSIHPVVDNLIIRPLLAVRREETLAYCQSMGAEFRIDRSNIEAALLRNQIRRDVLPLLCQLNPRAVEAIARAAENLRADESYFDELTSNLLPGVIISMHSNTIRMSAEKLKHLHPSLRRRLIRQAIRCLQGDSRGITTLHIEAIEKLLGPGKSGRHVELPSKLSIWREFDSITFSKQQAEPEPYWCELRPEEPIVIGGFTIRFVRNLSRQEAGRFARAMVFDDEELPERLAIRSRKPGDRYVPEGKQKPKKLKAIMLARRIPITQRELWPIIVTLADDRVICSPRLPPAAEFTAREQTKRFAVIVFEGENSAFEGVGDS